MPRACCRLVQVAAARGYPKLLQKDLATGIEIVLDRAGQVNPLQAAGNIAMTLGHGGICNWGGLVQHSPARSS